MTMPSFPSTRNSRPHPSPSTATPNTSLTRSSTNANGMGAHNTSPGGREKALRVTSGYQPPNSRLVWPSTVGLHDKPTPNLLSPYPQQSKWTGEGCKDGIFLTTYYT